MHDLSSMTPKEIKALIRSIMTPAGGFTRKGLESLGVPWPPPAGWKNNLINKMPFEDTDVVGIFVPTIEDLEPGWLTAKCSCGKLKVWAFSPDRTHGESYCPNCQPVPYTEQRWIDR